MINIIGIRSAIVDHDHAPQQVDDIPLGDHAMGHRHMLIQVQLLIELVTPNFFQVIMALIKELLFEELLGVIECSRVAGAHAFEELKQCCLGNTLVMGQIPFRLLKQRGGDEHAVRVVVHTTEQLHQFFFRASDQRRRAFRQAIADSRQRP